MITGNYSNRWAAGIWCTRSDVTIKNCTIVGNSSQEPGGGIGCYDADPVISNCIIWGNQPPSGPQIVLKAGSNPSITYCDVQGGWPGKGNIDSDPCFVDADSNDYRLLEESPCIDSGDPNYVAGPNETDLDGNPRISDDAIDMGAYEYSPPIEAEVNFRPSIINLAGRGRFIFCHIRLPEGYDVNEIEPNSILLEDEIEPVSVELDEQEQVTVTRFRRSEIQGILDTGWVGLLVSGELTDGTIFEGTDTIRVINKGKK